MVGGLSIFLFFTFGFQIDEGLTKGGGRRSIFFNDGEGQAREEDKHSEHEEDNGCEGGILDSADDESYEDIKD